MSCRAAAQLQHLNGIGAFYAALITIRGTGFADILPAAAHARWPSSASCTSYRPSPPPNS
jgi:hypothetical protein